MNTSLEKTKKTKIVFIAVLTFSLLASLFALKTTIDNVDIKNQDYANIAKYQIEQIKKSIIITKALGKFDLIKNESEFTEIMNILISEKIMHSVPTGINGEQFYFSKKPFGDQLEFVAIDIENRDICKNIGNNIDLKYEMSISEAYKTLSYEQTKLPFCFKKKSAIDSNNFTVAIKL